MNILKETNRNSRRIRAFTLVELLVVIAIIALLAAILFPVFARARENARRASCQSNLKQIGIGFHQYVQDYDGRLPLPAWYELGVTEGYSAGAGGPRATIMTNPGSAPYVTTWVDELEPYVKSTQIYTCPSDQKPNYWKSAGGVGYLGAISYGMNEAMHGYMRFSTPNLDNDIFTATPNSRYWSTANIPLAGQLMSNIANTSAKILAGDVDKTTTNRGSLMSPAKSWYGNCLYYAPPATADVNNSTAGWAYSNSCAAMPAGNTVDSSRTGRHFGGANILFVDGHVKWLGPKTIGLTFMDLGTDSGTFYSSVEALRYWSPFYDG